MIVKFLINNEQQEWVLMDGIEHIKWYEVKGEGIPLPDTAYDYTLPDSQAKVYEMFCLYRDREGKIIRVNSPIYLLNNEGKTIERL